MYDAALLPQYWFVLGGRGTGLSSLAAKLPPRPAFHLPGKDELSIGVYDPGRLAPLDDVKRTVLAMSRFDTRVCREHAPGYSPKSFLTEEQFWALRGPLGYVPVERVFRMQGADAVTIARLTYGTSEPPYARAVRAACDSRGRPVWPVLKALEPYFHSDYALTRDRIVNACVEWALTNVDLWAFVAPMYTATATLSLPRAYSMVRKYVVLRDGESAGDFVERCAHAGVWRHSQKNTLTWGPVWQAAAGRLSSTKTLDELRATMRQHCL